MTIVLNIRRIVATGLAVIPIGAIWHVKTIAQENLSSGVVTVFDHEKVDTSFAKAASAGGSNYLWSHTSGKVTYSVHTHSRDSLKSGCKPEGCSHKGVTEVMYVVSGAATVV